MLLTTNNDTMFHLLNHVENRVCKQLSYLDRQYEQKTRARVDEQI